VDIEAVAYAQGFRGCGHELHQPLCAHARDRFRIETGFDRDDGAGQFIFDVETLGVLGQWCGNGIRTRAPFALAQTQA